MEDMSETECEYQGSELVGHVEWLSGEYLSLRNLNTTPQTLGRAINSFLMSALKDIQSLTSQGFDLSVEDEDGKTALEVAIQGGLPASFVASVVPQDFTVSEWFLEEMETYLNDEKFHVGNTLPGEGLWDKLNALERYLDKDQNKTWEGLLNFIHTREQAELLEQSTPIRNTSLRRSGL